MGNVQSETTQESESAKDGEEKANPQRSKPDRVQSSSTKHVLGNGSPSPKAPELKAASPPLSSEPGGGDRHAGAVEMGKNHSKKSKLKLSSMWAQNAASGGMKEASLCDQDTGAEKRGLACLSRADLQGRQGLGNIFQEEPKGLKAALKPQGVGAEARDLGTKRGLAKGKGKPEAGHLDKNTEGPLLLQPEKLAELDQVTEAPKNMVEREVCWTQHTEACAKEYLENEGQVSEASAKKQVVAMTERTESSKMTKEVLVDPRSLNERSPRSPSPLSYMLLPGGKTFLSWMQKEKEHMCHRDNALGRKGDSKDSALFALLPEELANAFSDPTERSQASKNEAKAEVKNEDLGAEAVGSETVHELLEKGLNFLYKVTIQPGQWQPSHKAVKQKPAAISSGISYADVLKQSPQKKSPAGAPVSPKALQHLTAAGKKLPPFKGLERNNPEDFSSLSHMFLERFKKATPPKEPTLPQTPMQQVVTFFEELSTSNTKRTEWQRPRPPTPYPQRRKTQGRKLPKFATSMSQFVAFLDSNPKGDWHLHDGSQASLAEAMVAAEEGDKDHTEPPTGVNKGAEEAASSSPTVASLSLAWEISTEVDETPQKSRRRLQGLEKGAKETSALKIGPFSTAWGLNCPLAPTQSLQKEEAVMMPLLNPVPHSSRKMLEAPRPAVSAPRSLCVSIGLIPDQKTPAVAQTRPKTRKQGSVAPKSKEKLKTSGQPKAKPPKGKGQKQWPRGYDMTPPLKLEGAPLFPPFEKVARPFYFGEPLETPLALDKPDVTDQDATPAQDKPVQDQEADQSPGHHWPAFQVANSCSMKCYCKHRDQRKLPKNVMAWLNPSNNHLAEPPWVATAMLAVSLVAGTKFCLDSFDQQHVAKED